MDNIMLLTIHALEKHVPEKWTSFKDLIRQIDMSARFSSSKPFFMIASKEKEYEAIFATAMLTVKKVKGDRVYFWLQDALKATADPDITKLPEVMAKCPDKSILPIA